MKYKLVNVHGPLGVGKSNLMGLLKKAFSSFVYVDRPRIKRGLKALEKPIALKLSKDVSFYLLDKLMDLKANIFTEEISPKHLVSNFKDKLSDYELISFYLTCSVDEAISRDLTRGKTVVGESRVRQIHSEYRAPESYEIVLNTEESSVEEVFSEMVKRIKSPTS